MAQTVAYQRARVLEADGAIAGSSRQHQDHDIGGSLTEGDNALSEGSGDLIQPENQLGIYPVGVHPWDEHLNDEQRVAERFGLWFRQLMETDSGKEITISK